MHEEIYLPAELAIRTTNALLDLYDVNDCCIRTFLTTSRSYRRYIVNSSSFSVENKEALLQIDMPKFVWISEFFDEKSSKDKKAQGVFILDATSNTRSGSWHNDLIMGIYQGRGIINGRMLGKHITRNTNFPTQFARFGGNLKS